MSDFTQASTYIKEASYVNVKFGDNTPLTENALNEAQDIQRNKLKNFISQQYGDGVFSNYSINFASGTLTVANTNVFLNGELIYISNLSIALTEGQSVYLDTTEVEKIYSDTIKKYGNLQETNTATNKMLDSRFGFETSRRNQLVYTLSTSNATAGHNYLKLGTITSGAFVPSFNIIRTNAELLPLVGGTLSGTLSFTNSTTAFRGISGTMADNDMWRVGGAGTATDSGYLEIATSDNGNEPIYARQYSGIFGTLVRTLTLLDANGNTAIPGNMSVAGTASVSGTLTVTGVLTAPTASAGTNNTQVATTAFVATALANMVNAAPSTLDTLKELADALGDDPNFATTVTNNLATKAPLASPTFTGTVTLPTTSLAGHLYSSDGSERQIRSSSSAGVGFYVNSTSFGGYDWTSGSGGGVFEYNKTTNVFQLMVKGGSVTTLNNTLDNGSGNMTVLGTLSITGATTLTGLLTPKSGIMLTNENTTTSSTTIVGNGTAGNYFNGSAVGDTIIRNALNTNISFGFTGASGAENPALKLIYNATEASKVFTQRNMLDDGYGRMSMPFNTSGNSMQIGATADFNGNTFGLGVASPSGTTHFPFGVVVGGGTNAKVYLAVTDSGAVNTVKNVLDDSSGNMTVSGTLYANSINAGVELGSFSSVNTPYIDFHSSGNSIDYDARIMASDGTTTSGNGTIQFLAGLVKTKFNTLDDGSGNATVSGTLTVKNNSSGVATIVFPAQSNDAGFISHIESTQNVGEMRFSVSDDSDDIDMFTWGATPSGTWKEGARLTSMGNMTLQGIMTAKSIQLNTNTYAKSAISFYLPTYDTWQDYMAQSGAGNDINGGTAPTLGSVTGWARRSLVENVSGYGWIWESTVDKTNNSGTATNATAMMALDSSNGNLIVRGYVTSAGLVSNTQYMNLAPVSGGQIGFTNSARSKWGLMVADNGGNPTAVTLNNTLDDGNGNMAVVGSIKVANKFTMQYNSTEDSFDFIYG